MIVLKLHWLCWRDWHGAVLRVASMVGTGVAELVYRHDVYGRTSVTVILPRHHLSDRREKKTESKAIKSL